MKLMKRIFVSLMLAVVLVLCMAPAALAAGETSYVDITGQHNTFLFREGTSYSKTDLFPNFKNVMPGDKLTQQVKITHKGVGLNMLKVYMRVVPHGAGNTPVADVTAQESNELLSQMHMTIKNGSKLIYSDSPDQAGTLADFVYLGRMSKMNSMTLTVTLTVPLEMDNEFADRIGEMDWEFMVEEIPSVIPKTGDDSNIGILIGVCVTSLVALILVIFFLIKKKKSR